MSTEAAPKAAERSPLEQVANPNYQNQSLSISSLDMREWSTANAARTSSQAETSMLDGFGLTGAGQNENAAKRMLFEGPPENDATNQTGTTPPSEVDSVRERLRANGINPDDVRVPIAVREPLPMQLGEDSRRFYDNHATMVPCVINDPELGLSRGADVGIIRDQMDLPGFDNYRDRPDGIRSFFRDHAIGVLNSMTGTLTSNFLQPDSRLRVMSVSNGTTVVDATAEILENLRRDPDRYASHIRQLLGDERGNQFIEQRRRELAEQGDTGGGAAPPHLRPGTCPDVREPGNRPNGGGNPPDSPLDQELFRTIANQLESVVEHDPALRASLDRYRDTARRVAENGGMIVLAVSNNGGIQDHFGAQLRPGSELSLFAMSDHVIAVGGSVINGTPGDNTDDNVWENSSRGSERYPPTVLAPAEIPSRQSRFGMIAGTSYAAPLVANTIGLMLTQNPNMTFQDVRRTLQENTHRIPGLATEFQGAGVLRMADAILAARAARRS